MSGYWAGILSILSINIIFAYGIFLPVATGQLNLGGAGFQALGAYAVAYLASTMGLPIAVNVAIGMALAGGIAFLIAFPILRTRGVYLVLATFAFAEVVAGLILNSETLGGAMGMSVPDFIDWYVPVIVAGFVTVFVFYLMSTRLGLTMRATHDDEVVTDLMGVSVRGVKVTAFAIGGALAGLAGGLYANVFSFVEIQGFNAMVSIYVLLYVLLGGTQTAWGPLVGATFFTLLPEALRSILPAIKSFLAGLAGVEGPIPPPDDSWRFVILGLFTVGMMALRPEGLITRTMVERLRFRRREPTKAKEALA